MYRRLCAKVLPELIPSRSRILVAISGGPDSVVLSHVLWRYSRETRDRKISLVLSHVNHGVRPESEEEAKMVMDLAQEWGIPCLVHRFNAKAYARELGKSFQEAAREWRYARWFEDMVQEKCQLLATAHHLGDQAETILYRLLRGSGGAGLAGIYPKKDGVIRPLLSVSKEEILAYCQEEGLPYALDRSNYEPTYDRNRIRLELLPLLTERYNPRIMEALGRTGELMRWDEEYLASAAQLEWDRYVQQETPQGVCLSLNVFQLPPALLSRLLRQAAAATGGDPRGLGFTYVEQILKGEKTIGWEQNLPGITVKIASEGLWFLPTAPLQIRSGTPENPQSAGDRKDRRIFQENVFSLEVPWDHFTRIEQIGAEVGLFADSLDILGTEGENPAAGNLPAESLGERMERGLAERRVDEDVQEGPELITWHTTAEAFDTEAILALPEPLVLRTRRPGDKMWFRGVGHKSLKKVCQEGNVPVGRREKMFLLAAGAEVLWLPGVKRSDCFRPVRAEKTVYCVIRQAKPSAPEIP